MGGYGVESKMDKPVFRQALEEHSAEGLEIMMGVSSFTAHGIIYILAGLMLAIFVWSFFGKADVIVSAPGRVEPDPKTRGVYSPTDGELVNVYVTEGTTVAKNDLVARIKASAAIQAAAESVKARLRLNQAERERDLFPQKKRIMQKELENLEQQIENKQKEYQKLTKEGLRKLSEEQKNQLKIARNKLDEARRQMKSEKSLYEKYERLLSTTGGGGISKKQLEEQRNAYLKAADVTRRLMAEMENLELDFSKQHTKTGEKIDNTYVELLRLRYQYEQKRQETEDAEAAVEISYRIALAEWEAAARIGFDDLDQDNFLKITAPVSGEVTDVAYTQTGEKVQAAVPIVSIASARARRVIAVSIEDRDRGLLKVGQTVKLKFAAFPFQRYGFIKGRLEYISPTTTSSGNMEKGEQPVYKGRVSLDRDFFMVNGEKVYLRYGMTAISEIVVRNRRFIDLALDPFRNLKG
jgi:hemolysin D